MPDIPIATGSVLFKGDMSQYERDIEIAEEKLQKLNKGLQDGSLKMAAYAAKGINTEMEKAAKATKRMMDEVRLGKMGVLMRDVGEMGKRFQQRMQQFGTVGMGVGASAIGAASVASPLAADTLTGSFKLLTASIGRDFVPLVKDLSYTLQMAAEKWRNLDGAVKENITSTVRMVAVAGAASLAMVGVLRVLSAIKNHPLIAALGIGITAGNVVNDALNNQKDEMIGRLQSRNLAPGQFDFVREDGRTAQLKAMGEEGVKQAKKEMHEAWVDYEEKRKRIEGYDKGLFGGSLSGGTARVMDMFTGGALQKNWVNDASDAQIALEKAKVRFNEVSQEKMPRREHMNWAMQGAVGGANGGGNNGMLLGGTGPSSYSSLNDFYRSMNLETTSGSQLEAKIKQEQIQNDANFRQDVLRKMDTLIGNAGKAS